MATLHEAKFMGFSIIFITKSGRSNSVPDLILEGEDDLLKQRKRGDLKKKNKKKILTCLAAHFGSFLGRKPHVFCR